MSMYKGGRHVMVENAIDVLLVEDDPGDVELTKESLDESKICVRLNVVEDGEELELARVWREKRLFLELCRY